MTNVFVQQPRENSMSKLLISLFLLFALPLSAAEATKPLVYRGRTFESWLESSGKELDEEYLQTTILALGAFGRNGHGAKAAEAICEAVEGQYFTVSDLVPVGKTAVKTLGGIPAKDVMPLLEKLFKDDDTNKQALACHVFWSMEHRFPEEKLPMLLEMALKVKKKGDFTSRSPAGISWSNILGRCDNSGKTVIAYLRELVKQKNARRFIDAFSSIGSWQQQFGGTVSYDWPKDSNSGVHCWYPPIIRTWKGPSTISEHGKDLLRFFEEEGMKSDDENIRKWSEYLLQKLKEAVPQETGDIPQATR
jgi:hypothetical protein